MVELRPHALPRRLHIQHLPCNVLANLAKMGYTELGRTP
jgi:hypothetical protein